MLYEKLMSIAKAVVKEATEDKTKINYPQMILVVETLHQLNRLPTNDETEDIQIIIANLMG
jgi:hypothetical protein